MHNRIKILRIVILTLLFSAADALLILQFSHSAFAQTESGRVAKPEVINRPDIHLLEQAKQRLMQAEQLQQSGDLPAALQSLYQALDIYESQKFPLGEQITLNRIGIIYFAQGKEEKALNVSQQGLKAYQALLKIIQNQPKVEEIRHAALLQAFQTYIVIGQAQRNLSQYPESISAFESLILMIQKDDSLQSNDQDYFQGKSQYLKLALGNLLDTYTLHGDNLAKKDFQKALEVYRRVLSYKGQALKIAQGDQEVENGMLEKVMIAYLRLGILYSSHEQYYQSIENYNQAIFIAKDLNNSLAEIASISGVADAYRHLDNYAKSLESFKKLQDVAHEKKFPATESLAFIGIARIYSDIGRYTESIKFLEQALPIAQSQKDVLVEQIILISLGRNYFKHKNYAEANNNYQKALKSFQEMSEYLTKIDSVDSLQKVCTSIYSEYLNDVKVSALPLQQQGLTIYTDKLINQLEKNSLKACLEHSWIGEIAALNEIGQVNEKQGNDGEALKVYRQALENAERIHDSTQEASVLRNMAMLHLRKGEIAQAMSFLQKALIIRTKNNEKVGQIMTLHGMGTVLIHSGEYDVAESKLFKAIYVFDELRKQDLKGDVDKVSLFDTQTDIYKDLQYALVAQKQTDKALEISEEGRVRILADLLTERLIASKKANVEQNTKLSPNMLKVAGLQQVAQQENATLVEYSIINSPSSKPLLYIWVIKPTGNIVFKAVSLETFGGSLNQLIMSSRLSLGVSGRGRSIEIEPVDESHQTEQLRKLHDLLIEPIATYLPTDPKASIIIVPHEGLFLVPFVALKDIAGRYLIEKHTLLITPSIQLLQFTHKRKQQLSNSIGSSLVIGNPTMPNITVTLGAPPRSLPSIAGAEKEAIEIAKVLQTKAIIGSQATKAAILPKLAQARIIHLATHGLLDDFIGLGTPGAIALAPDGNGDLNDGLLTASEIFNMKLNAELAVLSACDTGKGTVTGDGVIGLSRALIAAGVPSVLVSLWSVPDAPTAELMVDFYRNWREKKMDKAQALRQAMLTTMKTHPSPKDWAAFTLIGEAK